jgi:hypothetical protein
MDVSAAIVTAHGGRISVGVNPLPDGSFYPDEFRNLAHPFGAVRERGTWLEGLESVPNVAVVYDWQSELSLLPLAQGGALRVQQESTGLHNALLDAGIHFDVVNADRLSPSKYGALLLGDAVSPSPALLDALRAYVTGGGLLIATNETSLRDANGKRRDNFTWADLLGVRFIGVSPYKEANYCWLGDELRGEAPAYPALFLTEVLEVQCTSAKSLAVLVYPEGHRTPNRFTDGETPYTHFKIFTGKPLVTINRIGAGAVIYIAAPIGQEIAAREDPWLKRLVAFAVRKYALRLAVEVQAPPGIQVVFGRKDGGATHVLSFVNLYAGLVTAGGAPVHPQVGPIKVTIPLRVFASRPKTVQSIDAHGTQWKVGTNELQVEVTSIGHHALLVVA